MNSTYNYSDVLNAKNSPIQASELINNKRETIHENLYRMALDALILDIKEESETVVQFKKTHKFVEIKGDDYLKPSEVFIINTKYPYDKKKHDLKEYWNDICESKIKKDISSLYLDEDTVKYAELMYIDYVNGKCKFRSKLNGEEFWTGLNYINENTLISDDFSLKNTFTYKLQKLNDNK